jgi:hypothetical protein
MRHSERTQLITYVLRVCKNRNRWVQKKEQSTNKRCSLTIFVICTFHWVHKCEHVQDGCDVCHGIGEIKSAHKILVEKLKVYSIVCMGGGGPIGIDRRIMLKLTWKEKSGDCTACAYHGRDGRWFAVVTVTSFSITMSRSSCPIFAQIPFTALQHLAVSLLRWCCTASSKHLTCVTRHFTGVCRCVWHIQHPRDVSTLCAWLVIACGNV